MSKKFKFVPDRPEEGTPTLGVVYHLTRENEISLELGIMPIGWVVEDEEEEGHRFRPARLCALCRLLSSDPIHSIEAIEKAMPEFGTVPEEPRQDPIQQVLPMGLPVILDEE